ncbi:MAG: hypothetical protein ACLUP6_10740 [Anaerostipes hadrus]
MKEKDKKETHPSRMRGRGVEVSKTLFYLGGGYRITNKINDQ